jgi:hypothetical protein
VGHEHGKELLESRNIPTIEGQGHSDNDVALEISVSRPKSMLVVKGTVRFQPKRSDRLKVRRWSTHFNVKDSVEEILFRAEMPKFLHEQLDTRREDGQTALHRILSGLVKLDIEKEGERFRVLVSKRNGKCGVRSTCLSFDDAAFRSSKRQAAGCHD